MPEAFEFCRIVLAVICCSAAIKLVDDYLDQDQDFRARRANWANILGGGTAVYAVLLMAVAAGISPKISVALFMGSYVVGMFNDMKRHYPSRLTGFQESALVFVIGAVVLGIKTIMFGTFFAFAVQLIDDLIDKEADQRAGYRNFAYRFGPLECALIALLGFLVSWWLQPELFLPVFIGTAVLYIGALRRFREGKAW